MEQWLTPPLVISLAALCLSGLNSYYTRKQNSKQDFDKRFEALEKAIEVIEKRMTEAETSLKVLSKQMELFWRQVEQQMAKKFRDE